MLYRFTNFLPNELTVLSGNMSWFDFFSLIMSSFFLWLSHLFQTHLFHSLLIFCSFQSHYLFLTLLVHFPFSVTSFTREYLSYKKCSSSFYLMLGWFYCLPSLWNFMYILEEFFFLLPPFIPSFLFILKLKSLIQLQWLDFLWFPL